MLHLVFNRANGTLKVFEANGSLWDSIDAGGDAVGVPAGNPYGLMCPCAPGHYVLSTPQPISPPSASEGAWQIPVNDVDSATMTALIAAGKAASKGGSTYAIGGVDDEVGQLGRNGRTAIMIHGGGTALGNPGCFAPFQELCKTEGCTRVHNADLARLALFLSQNAPGNTVVYTIVGAPLKLAQ